MKKVWALIFFIAIILSFQLVSASKFVVVGHFYTLQEAKDIRELFVEEINNLSDLDGVLFLGDTIEEGTDKEWRDLRENVAEKITAPSYFAPGNHDLYNFENYFENVGYTSKKVSYDDVNLYLLNSVNAIENNFNRTLIIYGGGLDDASIDLLENIKNDGKINLIFMHHSLYSEWLYPNQELSLDKISMQNNEKWKQEVIPLIDGKVKAVFMGDGYLNEIHQETIGNITYYGNAFSYPRERLSYTVIEINKDDLDVEIKYISVPDTFGYSVKFTLYKINNFFSNSWYNFKRFLLSIAH